MPTTSDRAPDAAVARQCTRSSWADRGRVDPGRRRIRVALRVASLIGLAACTSFCASGGEGLPTGNAPSAFGDWIEAPPEGCAVGSSGPTLDPRDAIRGARLAAIETLASASLAVDVQSITGTGNRRGSFEMSAQALSGTLENARIVALWAETERRRDASGAVQARLQQVFALACRPEASRRAVPSPPYPSWLLEPASAPGRICAVGIAGPTWKSEDQPESALRDARQALAVALESRIEKRIYDDGRGVARIAREIQPSAAALARARQADSLVQEWFDAGGRGPVGLPNVLYGLACIDD